MRGRGINKKEILGADENPLLFLQPLPSAMNPTFIFHQAAEKMQEMASQQILNGNQEALSLQCEAYFLPEESAPMPRRD